MTTNSVCIQVAPDRIIDTLRQEAIKHLARAGDELVLDFSSVARIDAGAARAMEELADAADKSSARVWLRGVNAGIYRALKLLNVASRFSFCRDV